MCGIIGITKEGIKLSNITKLDNRAKPNKAKPNRAKPENRTKQENIRLKAAELETIKTKLIKKILYGLKTLNRGNDAYGIAIKNKKSIITAYSKSIEQINENIRSKAFSASSPFRIGNTDLIFLHSLHAMVGFRLQPIVDQGKYNSMIVANCEIYNWREISVKEKIRSANDAELLLGLLNKMLGTKVLRPNVKHNNIVSNGSNVAERVLEALSLLDGIYAFAYANNEYLVLSRDILGVNPLWIALDKKQRLLGFASTKQSLERLGFNNVIELNPRLVIISRLSDFMVRTYYKGFFSFVSNKRKCEDLSSKEVDNIKNILTKAVAKRIGKGNIKTGLLFSGGLDSSVLAKIIKQILEKEYKKHKKNTMYNSFDSLNAFVVGVKGSKDIEKAGDIAKKIGINIIKKELTEKDVESLAKEVVRISETTDPVKVSVGIVTLAACKLAKSVGCRSVITGLGADELFMGYYRQLNIPDSLNKVFNIKRFSKHEIISSLRKVYERDCYRDNTLAMSTGVEIRLPFLDTTLINRVLRFPDNCFYENKKLLRIIAKSIGLSKDIVNSKKKSAQYSSGVYKSLKSIAKRDKTTVSEWLYRIRRKPNARLCLLASTGKDSWAAAWIMHKRNYSINCLLSIIPSKNSYLFHHPCIELVRMQSEASGIPLISVKVKKKNVDEENVDEELKALEKALKKAIRDYNIEGVITGALYSNYQRNRFEHVIDSLGLKAYNPLWHTNQEAFMRMISKRFRVVISKVSAEGLNPEWVGSLLTKENVEKLIDLSRMHGFNAAGEGGEFETLVLDMPLFKKQIVLKEYSVEIDKENHKCSTLKVGKAILLPKEGRDGRVEIRSEIGSKIGSKDE